MPDRNEIEDALFQHIGAMFPGPEITDALCNAKQLVEKYQIQVGDSKGIAKCAQEAIAMTLEELEGVRQHKCPAGAD